ncbi:putative NAD-P-binding protein [Lyophyllum shimeji]|uniref:NAD-P-binding protein n=1 Tax=Lyophyllum shimeji TaxID=47721 RepID=A0A9P3UWC7_LYOSH|nr:putative NAD-P-binding protein [Lyophyllum shimeji]
MPAFDKKTTATEVADAFAADIKGKTVIVTGVTAGGYGAEVARVLASHGAKVVLAGRSSKKIQETAENIRKETPKAELRELVLDLSSQKSVRSAAEEVLKYSGPVDVAILNAGIMGTPYAKTAEGLESQFGSNHVGHFLFTNLIMPKLLEAPAPRVVSVASVGHFWGPVRFDDYGFEEGKTYDKWAAYGQSKTANILFAVEVAERYKPTKLKAFSLHPGGAATGIASSMTKEDYEKFSDYYNPDGTPKGDWMGTLETSTATHLVAAFDPSIADKNGAYLVDGNVANEQAAPYALDKDQAAQLWTLSEELVGQKFAPPSAQPAAAGLN